MVSPTGLWRNQGRYYRDSGVRGIREDFGGSGFSGSGVWASWCLFSLTRVTLRVWVWGWGPMQEFNVNSSLEFNLRCKAQDFPWI